MIQSGTLEVNLILGSYSGSVDIDIPLPEQTLSSGSVLRIIFVCPSTASKPMNNSLIGFSIALYSEVKSISSPGFSCGNDNHKSYVLAIFLQSVDLSYY